MKIDYVHLHVSDAERALRFYCEALGAEEAFRVGATVADPDGTVFEL